MRIAVIGTGTVGRTLGEGLAKAGHDVVVGTRDPARTRARDEWQATSLSLGSYGEVGAGAELFVNATSGPRPSRPCRPLETRRWPARY